MEADRDDLTNIDFDNDWKCYFQLASEENMMIAAHNVDKNHRWSSIGLPHLVDMNKSRKFNKWWYCKRFDWASIDKQLYLTFEPDNDLKDNSASTNITATIWLNNTQIFSGLFMALTNPIELSSKLLHSENIDEQNHNNSLVICCSNSTLSLHARLTFHGKLICATGQVNLNEASTKKHKASFKPIPSSPKFVRYDRNENKEELKDDLLIPRLAILILIVGTRGDVQPFIA
jgi:hypothetical protein